MEVSNSSMACDHIKPCNISQSERHNRRDADYIASLNPRMLYIRQELTCRNESYVTPDVVGKSLEEIYNDIKAMVKQKTGRRMQERQQEYTDKRGRKKVRNGSRPLRESVVRMKPDTTMEDLQSYAQQVQHRWGIRAIQIHIHRDEGHYVNPNDKESWVPNLHAHIIWDWMNHETGKSYKPNIQRKKNEGVTLDKQNETKRKTSTDLDTEIKEKKEQAKKLKTRVEQSLKEKYAIKHREDWQGPMFTGMAKYLYETDEQLRFCVDSIADFARSGAGCRGGNHGAIFFDEEASAIKSFIARLAEIAATTIKNVAQ